MFGTVSVTSGLGRDQAGEVRPCVRVRPFTAGDREALEVVFAGLSPRQPPASADRRRCA